MMKLDYNRLFRVGIIALAVKTMLVVAIGMLCAKPRLQKKNRWLGGRLREDIDGNMLVIEEAIVSSPAHDVGLLPGDSILSYKGIPCPKSML